MRPASLLSLVTVTILALPSAARATGNGGSNSGSSSTPTTRTRTWNACGGPTVHSLMCASVEVAVTGTTTVVRVRNLSGDLTLDHDGAATSGQWILTTIGFDGIAGSAGRFTTGTGLTIAPWEIYSLNSIVPPAQWTRFDDKVYGAGVNLDFGIDNGPGISNGIASSCAPVGGLPGGSNRFWMTPVDGCNGYFIAGSTLNDGWFESGFVTAETWDPRGDDVSVFFKGQNGPGGASYECLVGDKESSGNCTDTQFDDSTVGVPDGPPSSTVPEPGTFVLVGTGVAVALTRKRIVRLMRRD